MTALALCVAKNEPAHLRFRVGVSLLGSAELMVDDDRVRLWGPLALRLPHRRSADWTMASQTDGHLSDPGNPPHCERFDMTKILIAYGTTEGQTARIADHIADVIRSQGHEADVLDLKRSQDALWMPTTQPSSEARSIWASMTSTFVTSFGETVPRSNVFLPLSSR